MCIFFLHASEWNLASGLCGCSSWIGSDLTALTNNNLRLKVPYWRLWAYTDGSCLTYKSQQRVGVGVFIPATKTAIYVNSAELG